jgi:hypothetical protein
MSKNQQLIKKELEKLGHTGVTVEWAHNRYYYKSDQTYSDFGYGLGSSFEEAMENIEKEKRWAGGDKG